MVAIILFLIYLNAYEFCFLKEFINQSLTPKIYKCVSLKRTFKDQVLYFSEIKPFYCWKWSHCFYHSNSIFYNFSCLVHIIKSFHFKKIFFLKLFLLLIKNGRPITILYSHLVVIKSTTWSALYEFFNFFQVERVNVDISSLS